ncbi:MAG: cation:proton antiporter [Actinomycetota bacterium]|nr:cation:proton antiporter [Actinomycetota bacterium]
MPEISFTNAAIVAAVAFAVPLLLGFFPSVRLPAVALELVAGIVIGPSVLGWVEIDDVVQIMNLIGLAFLLLIAGLEVDYDRLRGRLLEITGLGFVVSFAIAIVAGFVLDRTGLISSPLLVAIMFSATGLGVIIPVLKDTRNVESHFGQLAIAAASIAEVTPILLLSLFFSGEDSGIGAKVLLLGGFGLLIAAVGFAVVTAEHSMRVSGVLLRLQDTTAQIRLRGAFLLLIVMVVLADRFGLEAILGAFIAGAVLKIVDRDQMMTHPEFRVKLEAAGFGVFIPFFFVASGIRFDGGALFENATAILKVPLFLALLLLIRGLPAMLYRRQITTRETIAAALLQATSLSFFVVAAGIGMELELISRATGAALIAAGLISVLVFPLAALTLLRKGMAAPADRAEAEAERAAVPQPTSPM